tara:strand:+ start:103 stop:246 length:144 start_codon:yes stop_codon:yes gene_type:complete
MKLETALNKIFQLLSRDQKKEVLIDPFLFVYWDDPRSFWDWYNFART